MLIREIVEFTFSTDLMLVFPFNVLLQLSVYEGILATCFLAGWLVYPLYTYFILEALLFNDKYLSNDNDWTSFLYLMPGFFFTYSNMAVPGMYYLSSPSSYPLHKFRTIVAFWAIYPWIFALAVPMGVLAVPGVLLVAYNQLQLALEKN